MKIGEVARAARVNIQTLRYYERRGLLAPPRRTASGYRDYDPAAVERVRFIKRSQALGFSLDEIARLLELRPGGTCGDVAGLVRDHLQQIDARIADLQAMRELVVRRAAACGVDAGCALLEATSAAD